MLWKLNNTIFFSFVHVVDVVVVLISSVFFCLFVCQLTSNFMKTLKTAEVVTFLENIHFMRHSLRFDYVFASDWSPGVIFAGDINVCDVCVYLFCQFPSHTANQKKCFMRVIISIYNFIYIYILHWFQMMGRVAKCWSIW